MVLQDSNLHTHTYRCKHAEGDVADYCQHAVAGGLKTLGISDHVALPDDRWLGVRMAFADLDDYIDSIEAAQNDFPDLRVLKAMECEYAPEYVDYYHDLLNGRHNCDYLIGAVHFFPHKGEWLSPFYDMNDTSMFKSFVDYFIDSMTSGLFMFMAHPDNFGASCLSWGAEIDAASQDILQAAADLDMPLEVNAYGLRKDMVAAKDGPRHPYPLPEFWQRASAYKIKVVVNSDAHRPQDVVSNLDEGIAFAEKNNLKRVTIEDLLDLSVS